LLVVPAAPALNDLPYDAAYREALLNADVAITDSAFMVLIWNFLERDSIPRVSDLEYLRVLLLLREARQPGNTLWITARVVEQVEFLVSTRAFFDRQRATAEWPFGYKAPHDRMLR
jgi:hypothetical protein